MRNLHHTCMIALAAAVLSSAPLSLAADHGGGFREFRGIRGIRGASSSGRSYPGARPSAPVNLGSRAGGRVDRAARVDPMPVEPSSLRQPGRVIVRDQPRSGGRPVEFGPRFTPRSIEPSPRVADAEPRFENRSDTRLRTYAAPSAAPAPLTRDRSSGQAQPQVIRGGSRNNDSPRSSSVQHTGSRSGSAQAGSGRAANTDSSNSATVINNGNRNRTVINNRNTTVVNQGGSNSRAVAWHRGHGRHGHEPRVNFALDIRIGWHTCGYCGAYYYGGSHYCPFYRSYYYCYDDYYDDGAYFSVSYSRCSYCGVSFRFGSYHLCHDHPVTYISCGHCGLRYVSGYVHTCYEPAYYIRCGRCGVSYRSTYTHVCAAPIVVVAAPVYVEPAVVTTTEPVLTTPAPRNPAPAPAPAPAVASEPAGWAMLRNDKFEDALREFEGLVTGDVKRADAHAGRAIVLGMLGRDADAIAAMRQAVDLDPAVTEAVPTDETTKGILAHLAQTYRKQARAAEKPVELHFMVGALEAARRDYPAAAAALAEARKVGDDQPSTQSLEHFVQEQAR